MANLSKNARNSVEAQERMFRLAERDYGLSVSALHLETGISRSTLTDWKNGTVMPAWALGELPIPVHLKSLILGPYEQHVAHDESGDGALDELGEETAEFTSDYVQATSPRSPGGPRIVPIEKARLKERAARVCAVARAAAR